ncbi:MAG: hypothetical protein DRJ03_01220 [Chloroflexi bacterium]|nr:MAG: hypothetical protein DRJ03_01220 [Chloroflexota bacterium]
MKVMVMASGGKDSCALTMFLADNVGAENILMFTNDNGFMSEAAWENLTKLQEITGCQHYIHHEPMKHLQIITDFFSNKKQGMPDVCGKCTKLAQINAAHIAVDLGIRMIYTGNTLSNFPSGQAKVQTSLILKGNVIRFGHPFVEEYNYPGIITVCEQNGFEWDPRFTNCKFIRSILRLHFNRFGNNPYEEELQGLYNQGHISELYYNQLQYFCTGRPIYNMTGVL